jgi:hypothetical protein
VAGTPGPYCGAGSGLDNDCDGTPDVGCEGCVDIDSDGWGLVAHTDCDYYVAGKDDCDDTDPVVHPYANINICDGKDTNCDTIFPDIAFEIDSDGDGWPNCNDCNTTNPNINPGVVELIGVGTLCTDGVDNDCDWLIDSQDPTCLDPCVDDDSDGFYDVNSDPSCLQPRDDCDDSDPAINPGEVDDTCNDVDNDCDTQVDEDYVPDNSCGVGECQTNNIPSSCAAGGVETACQEGAPQVEGPNGDPNCSDGLDNNCDGFTDEAGGDPACQPCIPTGLPDDNCDGIDDDCNFIVDDLYVAPPTVCGVGECASTGFDACQSGVIVDTCVAGTPGPYCGATSGFDMMWVVKAALT